MSAYNLWRQYTQLLRAAGLATLCDECGATGKRAGKKCLVCHGRKSIALFRFHAGLFHVLTIRPSEAIWHMIGLLKPHTLGGSRWSSYSIVECWKGSRTCLIRVVGPIGSIPGSSSGG